jgi:hypothetical protein
MIEDAYDTIVSLDDFEKLVIEQGWFENETKWGPILKMCDDLQTRDEIGAQFSAINDDEYGVYFSTELNLDQILSILALKIAKFQKF